MTVKTFDAYEAVSYWLGLEGFAKSGAALVESTTEHLVELLIKAKYIKRIPTGNPERPYRYIYHRDEQRRWRRAAWDTVVTALKEDQKESGKSLFDRDGSRLVHFGENVMKLPPQVLKLAMEHVKATHGQKAQGMLQSLIDHHAGKWHPESKEAQTERQTAAKAPKEPDPAVAKPSAASEAKSAIEAVKATNAAHADKLRALKAGDAISVNGAKFKLTHDPKPLPQYGKTELHVEGARGGTALVHIPHDPKYMASLTRLGGMRGGSSQSIRVTDIQPGHGQAKAFADARASGKTQAGADAARQLTEHARAAFAASDAAKGTLESAKHEAAAQAHRQAEQTARAAKKPDIARDHAKEARAHEGIAKNAREAEAAKARIKEKLANPAAKATPENIPAHAGEVFQEDGKRKVWAAGSGPDAHAKHDVLHQSGDFAVTTASDGHRAITHIPTGLSAGKPPGVEAPTDRDWKAYADHLAASATVTGWDKRGHFAQGMHSASKGPAQYPRGFREGVESARKTFKAPEAKALDPRAAAEAKERSEGPFTVKGSDHTASKAGAERAEKLAGTLNWMFHENRTAMPDRLMDHFHKDVRSAFEAAHDDIKAGRHDDAIGTYQAMEAVRKKASDRAKNESLDARDRDAAKSIASNIGDRMRDLRYAGENAEAASKKEAAKEAPKPTAREAEKKALSEAAEKPAGKAVHDMHGNEWNPGDAVKINGRHYTVARTRGDEHTATKGGAMLAVKDSRGGVHLVQQFQSGAWRIAPAHSGGASQERSANVEKVGGGAPKAEVTKAPEKPAEAKAPEAPSDPKAKLQHDAEHAPWKLSSGAYKTAKGVHQPHIAEISPMQYANLGSRQKAAYDAERSKAWGASAEAHKEWAGKVADAHAAGKISKDTPGLSSEARGVIAGREVEAQHASVDREHAAAKAANRVTYDDAKKGDVVHVPRYGAVVVNGKSGGRLTAAQVGRSGETRKVSFLPSEASKVPEHAYVGRGTVGAFKTVPERKAQTEANLAAWHEQKAALHGEHAARASAAPKSQAETTAAVESHVDGLKGKESWQRKVHAKHLAAKLGVSTIAARKALDTMVERGKARFISQQDGYMVH